MQRNEVTQKRMEGFQQWLTRARHLGNRGWLTELPLIPELLQIQLCSETRAHRSRCYPNDHEEYYWDINPQGFDLVG